MLRERVTEDVFVFISSLYAEVGATVILSPEGAVIIDMADLKNVDYANQRINAIWAALVGGVLTGDKKTVISSRLINGIDQAFNQSPYLGTE